MSISHASDQVQQAMPAAPTQQRRTRFSGDHRAVMAARRAEQLARVPGFDPIVGERQAATIIAEEARQRAAGFEGQVALDRALRIAAGKLPGQDFARRHRAPRPSKSDDPAYRDPSRRIPTCEALG